MEIEPRLVVSSDRLEKPGTEPETPNLQGDRCYGGFYQKFCIVEAIWTRIRGDRLDNIQTSQSVENEQKY